MKRFNYRRLFWIILLAGLVLRILYITYQVVDLAPDETYYWQWSRHLDISYYSKGPLVAYLIHLGTLIGGHTPLGVRLPSVLLFVVTLYVSYRLYSQLFPNDELGLFLIAVFAHAIPLMMVGSIIMTIDPPLCAAWMIATWMLYTAVKENDNVAWLYMAIALGLGILAKYTMLLFIVTILFYLLWSKENRKHLTTPAPYLAIMGGLLFLLLPIIWNIQNGWVTLEHNLALGKIDQTISWGKNLLHFPEMILVQSGIISPLMFILLVTGTFALARRAFSKSKDDGARLLIASIAPVFIFYTLLCLKRSINANWLAVIYPLMILAGAWYWSMRLKAKKGRGLVISSVGLGIAMCLLLLFSDLILLTGLPNAEKYDPAARLKGWIEFAQLARDAEQSLPDNIPVFYFGSRYQTASELAFYLPYQPQTYCASDHPLSNQYDIWGESDQLIGWNAVYVKRTKCEEDLVMPDHIRQSFQTVEEAGSNAIERYGYILRYDKAWRCINFKGWVIETELR